MLNSASTGEKRSSVFDFEMIMNRFGFWSKSLAFRYGLIAICLLQFFCTAGSAFQLRKVLVLDYLNAYLNSDSPPLDLGEAAVKEQKSEASLDLGEPSAKKQRGEESFVGEASAKKQELEPLEFLVQLRKNFDQLPQLSKSQLEKIIEYSEILKRLLLVEIKQMSLADLKVLLTAEFNAGRFNANKAYEAAIVAKYVVNFGAARAAAVDAARQSAMVFLGGHALYNSPFFRASDYQKSISSAIDEAAWQSAWFAADEATRQFTWFAADEASDTLKRVQAVAQSTVMKDLEPALVHLKEWDLSQLGQKAYVLSELLVLKAIIENGEEFYGMAFRDAYNKSDGSQRVAKVKKAFGVSMDAARLHNNIFVIEFRNLLSKVEKCFTILQNPRPGDPNPLFGKHNKRDY